MECRLLPGSAGILGCGRARAGLPFPKEGVGEFGHTLTRALDPSLQQHGQEGAGGPQNAQGHLRPRAALREKKMMPSSPGAPLAVFLPAFPCPDGPGLTLGPPRSFPVIG